LPCTESYGIHRVTISAKAGETEGNTLSLIRQLGRLAVALGLLTLSAGAAQAQAPLGPPPPPTASG